MKYLSHFLTLRWLYRGLSLLAFAVMLYKSIMWAKHVHDMSLICILPVGNWRFTNLLLLLLTILSIFKNKMALAFAMIFDCILILIYGAWYYSSYDMINKWPDTPRLLGLAGADIKDFITLLSVLAVAVIQCHLFLEKGKAAVTTNSKQGA